jgi:hypothetical protein
MAATTTFQLVRSDAVCSMTRYETSFKQEVLPGLIDIDAPDPEILAALELVPDVDVQRTREETFSGRSLEDPSKPLHAGAKVAHAVSNATDDFHLDAGSEA